MIASSRTRKDVSNAVQVMQNCGMRVGSSGLGDASLLSSFCQMFVRDAGCCSHVSRGDKQNIWQSGLEIVIACTTQQIFRKIRQ
jgi:hypothetical protein